MEYRNKGAVEKGCRPSLGRIFEYFVVSGLKTSQGLVPFKTGLEQFTDEDPGKLIQSIIDIEKGRR